MASVDVIVPCYNYGRFLRECVGSALSQEGVDVRVLIIDDCSTDDSAEIGRAIAAADSRVEFRRHEKNRGHIATYNEGIDWVSRDYCLLLSADDLLTAGALARATSLMDAHPEVTMTHGRAITTNNPSQHTVPPNPDYQTTIVSGMAHIEESCRLGENTIATPTVILRTSVQKEIGGYRVDLPHSGDMEMWLRCAVLGSIGAIHADQAIYRRHGQNMSNGFIGYGDVLQRKLAFDAVFDRYGSRIPNAAKFRQAALTALCEFAYAGAYRAFECGDAAVTAKFAALANELVPGECSRRRWVSLRIKRMIGPWAWTKARPVVRRLLGRRTTEVGGA